MAMLSRGMRLHRSCGFFGNNVRLLETRPDRAVLPMTVREVCTEVLAFLGANGRLEMLLGLFSAGG